MYQQRAKVEQKVGYAEFGRMSVIHAPGVSRVPEWTGSDENIKRVVTFHLCSQLRDIANQPQDLSACRDLDRRILMQYSKNPATNFARHAKRVKRAGGPLAFWTTLIYRRYRLRMSYYELEDQYGVPAEILRTHLCRINRKARFLFAEFAPKRKQGTIDEQQVIGLRKQGLSRRAIGRELGWDRGVILRVLRRHHVD
ncbi:MAG TPA: helix-turn-helix domain-containing protein [Terriglobales bacterium]|nr:helix-turn-helix domain-containing protein [Terriglobales bacterium]